MKRSLKLYPSIAVGAAFAAAPTHTIQPGRTVKPDGFPNGEPDSLNILGKKD